MRVSREDKNDVAVLRLEGKLTGGPDSEIVYESVERVVAEGKHRVLLDLEKVPWVDSPGLGKLMAIHALLQSEGEALRLMKVSARIRSILAVTKLSTVFKIFDEEAEALASFRP